MIALDIKCGIAFIFLDLASKDVKAPRKLHTWFFPFLRQNLGSTLYKVSWPPTLTS